MPDTEILFEGLLKTPSCKIQVEHTPDPARDSGQPKLTSFFALPRKIVYKIVAFKGKFRTVQIRTVCIQCQRITQYRINRFVLSLAQNPVKELQTFIGINFAPCLVEQLVHIRI